MNDRHLGSLRGGSGLSPGRGGAYAVMPAVPCRVPLEKRRRKMTSSATLCSWARRDHSARLAGIGVRSDCRAGVGDQTEHVGQKFAPLRSNRRKTSSGNRPAQCEASTTGEQEKRPSCFPETITGDLSEKSRPTIQFRPLEGSSNCSLWPALGRGRFKDALPTSWRIRILFSLIIQSTRRRSDAVTAD